MENDEANLVPPVVEPIEGENTDHEEAQKMQADYVAKLESTNERQAEMIETQGRRIDELISQIGRLVNGSAVTSQPQEQKPAGYYPYQDVKPLEEMDFTL